MSDDERIEELLDRYQDLLVDGQVPSLDALCQECPELRSELERRVSRLRRVGQLLGDPLPPAAPEPPLSLSDDKTWPSQATRDAPPVEIPAPPGYEVLAPLGEGGMGIVYKARQIGLNRDVALKMILSGTRARAVDLARFREEAQAIAALRHPSIVQVFEIGEFRGQPFFSLEFCAGGTLSKALNGEPQSPLAAAGMAAVLARAVHYAHTRGIVHRDLKPGNVLLSADFGAPYAESSTIDSESQPTDSQSVLRAPHSALKITDFGLAKRVDDDSGKTQDGSIIGTPSYMAPEQAFGASKEIGPHTDIHALGAMLYEFLTGRPPFKGSTVHETLEQVRYREPVRVRELQPIVPVDLETICLKCLQKDAKKRYSSAEALADDLIRFQTGKSIKARPLGQLVRLGRWCKRDPRTAVLGASTALLVVLLAAVLGWFGAQFGSQETLLQETQRATAAAIKEQNAARKAEESQRYFAAISDAGRQRIAARPGWTWDARKRVEVAAATNCPARDLVALRGELAATMAEIDLRPIGVFPQISQAGALVFLPDGRLAIAPQLTMLFIPAFYVQVIDPHTKAQQRLSLPPSWPSGKYGAGGSTALAASPDGRWLALGLRGGKVLVWDMTAKPDPQRRDWKAHEDDVTGLAFSPDCKWLYTGGHDGAVKRWNVSKLGKPEAVWKSAPKSDDKVKGLAYWDGARPGILVHGSVAGHFLDPQGLKEVGPGSADQKDWAPPALAGFWDARLATHSPTGTIVTSAGGELTMTYWERNICVPACRFADRGLVGEGIAHTDTIEAIAIHPSGMLLASACASGGIVKVWHLGTGELTIAIPASNARAVAFSADGKFLAVGGENATTLYEVGGLRAQTFLGRRGLTIRAMGLTADGDIGTVSSRRNPQRQDREDVLASVWSGDGKLKETVLSRTDAIAGRGQVRVAASPAGEWTAFAFADGAVTWRGPPGRLPNLIERPSTGGRLGDLAIDRSGRCWTIDNTTGLSVRPVATEEKSRAIALGWPWTGRQGFACVRAGGEHVLVGCENGFLRIVRPTSGTLVVDCLCFDESATALLTESANTVHAVDLLADETRAIAGTEDGRLWLFSLPSGNKLAAWPAHMDRVTAVAFDPTGRWLASGGRDRKVRLWQQVGNRYEPYVTLEINQAGPVRQVMFSSDGRRLLVLHEKEMAIRVWHLDQLDDAFRNAGVGR